MGDRGDLKAAKSLQVNIRGTLSIILLAKQTGHIASASNEISKLVESRFRVSTKVLAKVLELAEE
ncbi:MAG: DUF3368 domain-containing protein [Cyanobacteria bacterium J06626_4]